MGAFMHDDPDREKAQIKFDVILHLIGQVVVAWGKLDDLLIHLLARLAGCKLKASGVTYYALDALSTRLAVIKGLAHHKLKPGKKRTALLEFLNRLQKLGTTRNDIIHAVYRMVYDPKSGKWIIKKTVFRSARNDLYQETIAQTGELETHLQLLLNARFWLYMNGWMAPARKLPPDLQAKITAITSGKSKA
jgi:hypothetical protein